MSITVNHVINNTNLGCENGFSRLFFGKLQCFKRFQSTSNKYQVIPGFQGPLATLTWNMGKLVRHTRSNATEKTFLQSCQLTRICHTEAGVPWKYFLVDFLNVQYSLNECLFSRTFVPLKKNFTDTSKIIHQKRQRLSPNWLSNKFRNIYRKHLLRRPNRDYQIA